MFTQEFLRTQLASRIRLAHPGRGDEAPDPGPLTAELLTELASAAEAATTTVTVVLRRFEPQVYAESVLRYALSLPDTLRASWLRAYTRTVFLTGNPANLTGRFGFHYVSQDGSMAWTAPDDAGERSPLRRLLRLFPTAELPPLPARLRVPATAGTPEHDGPAPVREARLYAVTTRVSLAAYLVHVHHVLAEAVIAQLIDEHTELTIHHVPQLDPADGPFDLLRVVPDPDAASDDQPETAGAGRLRAYAALTLTAGAS
ncbi:DUF6182 family protein [Streptomyces sp. NPDC059850]|uniref:DUF6182 family protein n=1 Tax=Streptomyces sp. NPDC059850 TaxID=3346970 RepID=UPI0036658AC2